MAFREASLVLSDPRTELPLSHWSLPAIERLNPGETPALYAPGLDAEETLELDDPDMIAALATIRGALRKGTARPGRLRGGILVSATLGILAIGAFFVPDALIRHTAAVLPPATRAQIGNVALSDIARLTGAPCDSILGNRALTLVSERLALTPPLRLVVLREGLAESDILPGNLVLLGLPMLQSATQPEVAAGHALAAVARSQIDDPMLPILRHAGLPATVRLLTTGALPEQALQGYGEAFLTRPRAAVPQEEVIAGFAAARLSSTAFGFALDPSGESSLTLIEADPFRNGSPEPLLTREDWASLQAICTG